MVAPASSYRAPARLIHWVMAVLLLMTIPAGFIMLREGIARPLQDTLFIFHKNVGVILLLLAVLRLAYRWRHPAPPLPASVPGWQRRIAAASHVALYVLIFAMPILGYVRVRAGGFPIEGLDAMGFPSLVPRSDTLAEFAKTSHYYGAIAITILIAAHVGAALQHGLLRRDGVFTRMWPPFGGRA
jgi:cytochrome b561